MCLQLRRSSELQITSMPASMNGGVTPEREERNGVWENQTIIHNKTGDTILLRDIHRYVYRQVRLEMKPNERKRVSIKAPSTFLRMGAILKVDDTTEETLGLFIETDQLVGRRKISICHENGRYFLEEQ